MKKISVVLLMVVCVMLIAVGCKPSSNETANTASVADGEELVQSKVYSSLENRYRDGIYNKKGFDSEYFVYRFDNTDLVVYKLFSDSHLLGADNAGTEGKSYGNVIFSNDQFIGLSDKYMLFLTAEGKIAISIFDSREKNTQLGRVQEQIKIPFDELTLEEQQNFIYPSAYEKVIQ